MVAKAGVARGTHRNQAGRPDMSWMRSAACHGEDLELFFGPPKEQPGDRLWREARASKICREYCLVRSACLDYALDLGTKHGVWGGLNPEERKAERRRRGRRAASGSPADVEDLASEEAS